jgi:hypothetical protein
VPGKTKPPLPESIKHGGGKRLSLTRKASGLPVESGNELPRKHGMVNGESEDELSGKIPQGFAAFIYLRCWEKNFPLLLFALSAGSSSTRKSRVK